MTSRPLRCQACQFTGPLYDRLSILLGYNVLGGCEMLRTSILARIRSGDNTYCSYYSVLWSTYLSQPGLLTVAVFPKLIDLSTYFIARPLYAYRRFMAEKPHRARTHWECQPVHTRKRFGIQGHDKKGKVSLDCVTCLSGQDHCDDERKFICSGLSRPHQMV